jgi:hypothetical protein
MHSKRAEDITDQRQPLLEVEEVPTLLNALCPYKSTGPVSTNDSKKTKCAAALVILRFTLFLFASRCHTTTLLKATDTGPVS